MQLSVFLNTIHIGLNVFGFACSIGFDIQSRDTSHFENNFKRMISCPATRPNANEPSIRNRAVEPDPKQFCMARAGAKYVLDGGAVAKILDC